LKLRVDASSPCRDEQILRVVEVLCPFLWTDDDDEEEEGDGFEDEADARSEDSRSSSDGHVGLHVEPLTGGLSNHLFVVSGARRRPGRGGRRRSPASASSTASVLVRVHPESDGSVEVVHREGENRFAAWLAAQNGSCATPGGFSNGGDGGTGRPGPDTSKRLAPTVYGRFENGRVEEFYQNVRPLTWGQMRDYTPQIAASMAEFHLLNAPSHVLPKPSGDDHSVRGTICGTTDSWLEAATKLVQHEALLAVNDRSNDDASLLLKELQQQWRWLKQQLFDDTSSSCTSPPCHGVEKLALAFIRRVVVTHMDCQPLNILIEDADAACAGSTEKNISSSTGRSRAATVLHLIDFEYSGWNPIAADIANTFCEYCEMSNLRADYESEYPSPPQQDLFFWNYVQRSDPTLAHTLKVNGISGGGGDEDWDVFSITLQREVGRFSLLSHLSWSVWSVVKSFEEDGVDFDYMAYAAHRMEGYAWAKARFFTDDCGGQTQHDELVGGRVHNELRQQMN
jgi:thiamine kinase-like enzyme